MEVSLCLSIGYIEKYFSADQYFSAVSRLMRAPHHGFGALRYRNDKLSVI
jgi:hypothetical protein